MVHQRSPQTPAAVIIVRPHHFTPNVQTSVDNNFQQIAAEGTATQIAKSAFDEVTQAIADLRGAGVRVHVFEDETLKTPDSVFPNNWFSTHPGGHVALYPMFAPNRRPERRPDVIEFLKRDYRVQDVIDYSGLEPDGLFLEGTGAMVLDHIDRIAYAIKSNRTNPVALERFCTHFNYEPMVFDAYDETGHAVYHTNVLMCIATDCVLIGSGMIADAARRAEIITRLESSGRSVIELSAAQISNFAGNAIELQGRNGRILALSSRAHKCLNTQQLGDLEKSLPLLPLNVPTIEMAGGSVRCMLAGVHLTPR